MAGNVIGSYNVVVAITKSDTVDIVVPFQRKPPTTDAIYVGASGDIVAILQDGAAITLSSAIAGTIIPIPGATPDLAFYGAGTTTVAPIIVE